MADKIFLGRKLRTVRRRNGMSQAALAEALGISASYLNLIEHEKRPLPAELLIKAAQTLDLDVRDLAGPAQTALGHDLLEVFGDPLFEETEILTRQVHELASSQPEIARAVVRLYHAYRDSHTTAGTLAERVLDRQDVGGLDWSRLSSEQVSDFLERHQNHFPALEEAATRVWHDAHLEGEDLFTGLSRYLEVRHGVQVQVHKVAAMHGNVREFETESRNLNLSEVLRRGSRNFQLAHQLGLLECSGVLDEIVDDPLLSSTDSRSLGRIALASYFAAAVLMPYDDLLTAAEEVRYDLDLLGHRFRASFEQVCHRLTTLRSPRRPGIPFDFVRVDLAGNLSKRLAISGARFPRFSGLCPLWGVHAAFLQPGSIRVGVSRMPDGSRFFSISRTVRKHRGGYRDPNVLHAISLSCDVDSARRLVYGDGIDLEHVEAAVPVGMTCRLCERRDCQARAFPSLQMPLRLDENRRGASFYSPTDL
ncbi:MAG: DUF2083 domain-containing protein [Candidatus Eisenbacteria bacterium]|uniref:DUF2083 domain-containing protein n=1 Tax=Eiseniibacteriota bacterium TaxID=2212470 RepID=A0A956M0H6_UNCEI|nr:DUF2083 domain-containing protein [Candidatus Eisenbacteria bacterium]